MADATSSTLSGISTSLPASAMARGTPLPFVPRVNCVACVVCVSRGLAGRYYLHVGHNSFLGQVDLYGTAFQDTTLATGYGAHIARPLMRKAYRPDLSEEEARK